MDPPGGVASVAKIFGGRLTSLITLTALLEAQALPGNDVYQSQRITELSTELATNRVIPVTARRLVNTLYYLKEVRKWEGFAMVPGNTEELEEIIAALDLYLIPFQRIDFNIPNLAAPVPAPAEIAAPVLAPGEIPAEIAAPVLAAGEILAQIAAPVLVPGEIPAEIAAALVLAPGEIPAEIAAPVPVPAEIAVVPVPALAGIAEPVLPPAVNSDAPHSSTMGTIKVESSDSDESVETPANTDLRL